MVLVVELLFLVAFAGLTVVPLTPISKPPKTYGAGHQRHPPLARISPRSMALWLCHLVLLLRYVLVSLFAKLTGVSAGISFNLGIALVFALSALGAYGLVLTCSRTSERRQTTDDRRQHILFCQSSIVCRPSPSSSLPLLGPLSSSSLVSNLEGFLQCSRPRLFWRMDPASGSWVSILEMAGYQGPEPAACRTLQLDTIKLSLVVAPRAVQDYDLLGNPIEIIDEFPVFSTCWPICIPAGHAVRLSAIAVASTCSWAAGGRFEGFHRRGPAPLSGSPGVRAGWTGFVVGWCGGLSFRLGLLGLVGFWPASRVRGKPSPPLVSQRRSPLVMGAFLHQRPDLPAGRRHPRRSCLPNTGTSPSMSPSSPPPHALKMKDEGGRVKDEGDEASNPFILHSSSFRFFRNFTPSPSPPALPASCSTCPYFGFSSQASGFLPNLVNPTRGVQLWVMFGSLSADRGLSHLPVAFLAGCGELSRGLVAALGILLALDARPPVWPGITFLPDLVVST
jgi:hypothetical protein